MTSIARRYANALFDVARRNGTLDTVGADVASLADLVAAHADLRQAFANPLIPPTMKRSLVAALVSASTGTTDEVGRLLLTLAEHDRLALVPDVAEAFAERAMEASHVVSAEVVTAVPLDDSRKGALADALAHATGREVVVSDRVDPSILGGVVARVGSMIFDGSVTRQLDRMRQQLVAEAQK